MLSNTATPKYYGQFRQDVLSGKIKVNENIEMQMNLIDNLIRNPGVYYDDKAIDGFISFCENELTLQDGSDLHLLDTFKLWAEDILSWFYYVEKSVPEINANGKVVYVRRKELKRLRSKVYLIVARGAAKSMFASLLQSYFLTIITTTTKQIITAPTVRQAEATMGPMKTAILRAKGPLYKFLTAGNIMSNKGSAHNKAALVSTKVGVENKLTGSVVVIVPMDIEKLQGAGPYFVTIDEWLSCDIREDVTQAAYQGTKKIPNSLLLAISSEGTIRNGPGDSVKMELMKVLKGEYFNPHISVWWYKLDDIKEVNDPTCWVKAQPNIGHTISFEAYQEYVNTAEHSPETRNDILAKCFGIPMEGFTYFFTYEETLPTEAPCDFKLMPCAMGGDMSQGNDFCAFTFLFPLRKDIFGIMSLCFITERTLNSLSSAMRIKYDEFINEGSLIIHNGTILDMDEVYDDVFNFIEEKGLDVRSFGFDPYNADKFVERWRIDHGPFGLDVVKQGVRTETVPLGELKMLAEDKHLLHQQSIVTFCMGNSVVIRDNNGGRKLMKLSYDKKIDVVSAMMDAFVSYKNNKEVYE